MISDHDRRSMCVFLTPSESLSVFSALLWIMAEKPARPLWLCLDVGDGALNPSNNLRDMHARCGGFILHNTDINVKCRFIIEKAYKFQ